MDGSTLLLDLVLIAVAYLCGSIPMGVVIARLTGGVDPRTVGSGRTGGTNALRALGRKRAAVVVAGDVLKGALPVPDGRTLGHESVGVIHQLGSSVTGYEVGQRVAVESLKVEAVDSELDVQLSYRIVATGEVRGMRLQGPNR